MLCQFLMKYHLVKTRSGLTRPFHILISHHKILKMFSHLKFRSVLPQVQPSAYFNDQKFAVVSIDEPPIKKYLSEFLKNPQNEKSALKKRNIEDLLKQREQALTNINSLNDLKQDKEMKELAEEELETYHEALGNLDNEIIKLLVPRSAHEDYSDIAVEISSGAGGQEAMLFAGELLELYENYANFRGWNFVLESVDTSNIGGIRSASFFISGSRSFYHFQNEIGVHRVQRVPITSAKGMIHTSTAAVVVMPQPTQVDIQISEKDLIVETMRASGPGGQNINKTESAVRVKHIPSGLVTECQEGKTQHGNKQIAIMKIRTKLYDLEIQKQTREMNATRQLQLGNRERSAKIRTYNFPQNRITDHRAQVTAHDIKEFMLGGETFHKFVEKVSEQSEIQMIKHFVDIVRQSHK
ncbi:Peptide chain release factor 1-like, mitochondrial [Frankliniella fusca]|uniref:Peptide chain release factor 1-like, mitochondrial n=1 Tax=Frankliniella fusca TaxID=407009 RepID=A0AAE1LQL1_9NEOP|nr:Peptide chain release factor 1-like, mitochondrial [Frankliniella fusca]